MTDEIFLGDDEHGNTKIHERARRTTAIAELPEMCEADGT